MTPPEARLWSLLRMRPDGLQFRRQHAYGSYVLDFFCRAAALAIEVDGEAHGMGDNPARDRRRDDVLQRDGVATLRIAAIDIRDNLEGVITHILEQCAQRTPPPAALVPLPAKSRGGSSA